MAGFKLKDFSYGSLNDIDKPTITKRIDLQSDTAVNVFKNLTKNLYTPNSTIGTGPYKGIVLRIEGTARASSQPEAGNWASRWLSKAFGSGGQTNLVQIKVRIPELHAMLPIPDELGSNSKDTAIIEMYPTFIAQSTEVPVPQEGGLVWVDFGNKVNFTDPIYIRPFTKEGGGSVSGEQGGKTAYNSNCAGVFLSNRPSGDVIAGKNKPLSHIGLPLYSRQTNRVVSQEYSFLKGLRFTAETMDKWQDAIKSKGPAGITWFGGLLSNGADESDHVAGKRDTLIFSPNTTDFSVPVELMYFFHGLNEFGDKHDFLDRFAVNAKSLSEEGRNFIFIIPELPWALNVKDAKSKSDLAWTNKDNFSYFHSEVLSVLRESFSNVINIGFISITAHGNGGSALKNAALFGGLNTVKPNKITFAEASYLDYADTVFDKYVSKDSTIEMNLLVSTAGAANKRAKDLVSKTTNNTNVYMEEMAGKNHQQIGDMALSFINPRQKKDIENKSKDAIKDANTIIKDEDIIEPASKEIAEKQKKDYSLKEPMQSNPKIPIPSNPNISPSAIPKNSTTPKAQAAVIKEAVPFQEARVRSKEYGNVNESLLVPVPSIEGKTCLLHKLVSKRLAVMNDAWQSDNPGVPPILIASGLRRHGAIWKTEEEYNQDMIGKYGSVEEGRKHQAFNSAHEVGLAMDIGNNGLMPGPFSTNEQQKQTRLYKWLVNNAHKFGFTPYKFEAWHWECRIPKESWVTGEEFTENLAVRVENIGGSHMPTNNTSNASPCVSTVGSNKTLPAPKGTFKPTSTPELKLTWNEFIRRKFIERGGASKGKANPPSVKGLLSLGTAVDQKWGELIKKYLKDAPYGIMCIRIGHESRGEPRCYHSSTGETGLLQLWCGGTWKKGQGPMSAGDIGDKCQKKLSGFDPFCPSHNLWGGLADVNNRMYRLKNSATGKYFPGPGADFQFFGCLMVGMNIGDPCLAKLLNIANAREGSAFTDLVEFITQIEDGLEQYQYMFGSQTPELIARRVLVVPYWLKAAEQIGPLDSNGFGEKGIPNYFE